jgi:putative PIN family toxin of toxin-antitoxin system
MHGKWSAFQYNCGYMGATKRIVLDTSVLIAAARSRQGASFALVSSLPNPRFQICLSVAVYTEWQAVLSRPKHLPPGFTRYLATLAHLQDIHFLWRPFLRDPDDDMLLECAVAAGCTYIVTHNIKDFRRTEQLGVKAVTPGQFLQILRETLT